MRTVIITLLVTACAAPPSDPGGKGGGSSSATGGGSGGGSAGAGGGSSSGPLSWRVVGSDADDKKPASTSVTTPAMSFGAGTVLLAAFGHTCEAGIPTGAAGDPTVTTPGLTWTVVNRACMNWSPPQLPCSQPHARRLGVLMATAGPQGLANVQTTFTPPASCPGELHWSITEWSGAGPTLVQNVSEHHGTWVPHKTFTFPTAIAPGHQGVIFWVPGSGEHTLLAEAGVASLLEQVRSTYYLGHRVSVIDPGYASSTLGHFEGVVTEPTAAQCDPPTGPPANGCAHGLVVGLELSGP